jgi:hypothetical protein
VADLCNAFHDRLVVVDKNKHDNRVLAGIHMLGIRCDRLSSRSPICG